MAKAQGRQATSTLVKYLCFIITVTISVGNSANAQNKVRTTGKPILNTPSIEVTENLTVAVENQDQTATISTAFRYDATQNGSTFSGGSGDALSYSIELTPEANWLTSSNGILSGTPDSEGTYIVVVTATDTADASISDSFFLTVGSRFASPQLPAELYTYEDSNATLPRYYRNGQVEDADNTPDENPITDEGATLGRVLFYDTQLSANNTVACASCHLQAFGFSDPRVLSVGFDGGETARHSMSLTNARFYERGHFFWDERSDTLEDQVLEPIQDTVEMGMTLTELEVKLQDLDYYPALFEDAFGDDTVTSERIALALAQFVRALTSSNSKFDEAVQTEDDDDGGFENVFTADELAGLVLFGQGDDDLDGRSLGCARCHGTLAHISDDIHNNGLDASVTGDDGAGDKEFKAPSLRNIEVGAPYMHDGRFSTLEEVIEFYNSGVQDHPDLDNRLQANNGNPRRLNMSDEEKSQLLAFLKTLTDEDFLSDERFSDPFVSN